MAGSAGGTLPPRFAIAPLTRRTASRNGAKITVQTIVGWPNCRNTSPTHGSVPSRRLWTPLCGRISSRAAVRRPNKGLRRRIRPPEPEDRHGAPQFWTVTDRRPAGPAFRAVRHRLHAVLQGSRANGVAPVLGRAHRAALPYRHGSSGPRPALGPFPCRERRGRGRHHCLRHGHRQARRAIRRRRQHPVDGLLGCPFPVSWLVSSDFPFARVHFSVATPS